MSRHAYEIADLLAERKARARMTDQRSEDAFPPLAPQAELDRIPVSDMHQWPEAENAEAFDNFAAAIAGAFIAGLTIGGAVLAWVTL